MKDSIPTRFLFSLLWLGLLMTVLLALLRTLDVSLQGRFDVAERELFTHYVTLEQARQQSATINKADIDDWWAQESAALSSEQELARLPVYRADDRRGQTAQRLHQTLLDMLELAPEVRAQQAALRAAMNDLQQSWQGVLDVALQVGVSESQRSDTMAMLYAQSQGFDLLGQAPAELWMNPEHGPALMSETARKLELSQTSFDALLVGNPRLQIKALESAEIRAALAQLREPMQGLGRRLGAAAEAMSPITRYWSLQRSAAEALSVLSDQRNKGLRVMPTWALISPWLSVVAVVFALLLVLVSYGFRASRHARHQIIQTLEQERADWKQQLADKEAQIRHLQSSLQSISTMITQLRPGFKPLLWPAWPEPDPLPALQSLCELTQSLQEKSAASAVDKTGLLNGDGDDHEYERLIDSRLQTLQLNLSLEAARQPALGDLLEQCDALLLHWQQLRSQWQEQAEAHQHYIRSLRLEINEQSAQLVVLATEGKASKQALQQLSEWRRIADRRRERNHLLQQIVQQLDYGTQQIEPDLAQDRDT